MVAALLRPIFNADTGEQARELVGDALERLRKPLPKVAALLEEAEEDLLAFYGFPADHWAEAALDQPARTGQPRDRPAHRRRRHLPQRPLPDPARRQRRDRAERRVARRAPLPQHPLAGDGPRSEKKEDNRQRGGPRTHRGLSSRRSCRRVTPRPGTQRSATSQLSPKRNRKIGKLTAVSHRESPPRRIPAIPTTADSRRRASRSGGMDWYLAVAVLRATEVEAPLGAAGQPRAI